jgi:hypothetical protein
MLWAELSPETRQVAETAMAVSVGSGVFIVGEVSLGAVMIVGIAGSTGTETRAMPQSCVTIQRNT